MRRTVAILEYCASELSLLVSPTNEFSINIYIQIDTYILNMPYRPIAIEGEYSMLYATYVIVDIELYTMCFYWDEGKQKFRTTYERDMTAEGIFNPIWLDKEEAIEVIRSLVEYNADNWRWMIGRNEYLMALRAFNRGG